MKNHCCDLDLGCEAEDCDEEGCRDCVCGCSRCNNAPVMSIAETICWENLVHCAEAYTKDYDGPGTAEKRARELRGAAVAYAAILRTPHPIPETKKEN